MDYPILGPAVADHAPTDQLTAYDRKHLIIYLRPLEADADGVDWKEVALTVLQIDPEREPCRGLASWESHLRRAK